MRKVLFLDLEDTIIDDFTLGWAASPCNIQKVKDFIESEAPDEVRLFSFALSNDWDVKQFQLMFEPWLSKLLGVTFNLDDCFTTDKLFRLCRRHALVFEDERECMLFHGKQYGFQRYIEMSPEFDGHEAVLLDDATETMTVTYPKRNVALRLVNVAHL